MNVTIQVRCARSRLWPTCTAALLAVGVMTPTGCGGGKDVGWTDTDSTRASASTGRSNLSTGPGHADGSTSSEVAVGAPLWPFAVGSRSLNLSRGSDRPLATLVWYPASGQAGGSVRAQATFAAGRFPVVLLSHGLGGLPENFSPIATRLATAGFVVAAPTYPHTRMNAPAFDTGDIPNQPLDAFLVIESIFALNDRPGDLFAGHIDTTRFAAAGHSAGGYTTEGMLVYPHDSRLRAAVVIAGGSAGEVTAPQAEVLFVHGDADPTVAYSSGRSAYARLPWPKAFLTIIGGDHGGYLKPGRAGYEPTVKTITDFLRATVYGDSPARSRLPEDGSSSVSRLEP